MDSIDWRTLLNGDVLGYPGYLTVDLGALRRNF
jgi:hypothetical protein